MLLILLRRTIKRKCESNIYFSERFEARFFLKARISPETDQYNHVILRHTANA